MSVRRLTISGTAAAASSLFTVTRTSCEPAAARAATWAAVPAASAVSVLVIDCTTTGCADPTGTVPTSAVTVGLRAEKGTVATERGAVQSNGQGPRCGDGAVGLTSARHHLLTCAARRSMEDEPMHGGDTPGSAPPSAPAASAPPTAAPRPKRSRLWLKL